MASVWSSKSRSKRVQNQALFSFCVITHPLSEAMFSSLCVSSIAGPDYFPVEIFSLVKLHEVGSDCGRERDRLGKALKCRTCPSVTYLSVLT